MPRYLLKIRYDGTDFSGWQKQPGQIKTIQNELQRVLSLLVRHSVELVASGRTDAGVHAECQFAHFDTMAVISDINQFLDRCNKLLDKSIYADNLQLVSANFHARFDAVSRAYRYQFSTKRDVFNDRYYWIVDAKTDVELIRIVSRKFIGIHDYASFSKHNPNQLNTLCSVTRSEIITLDQNRFCFEIEANRFLHHMVRTICGTLVNVGTNKEKSSLIDDCLANPDHKRFKYVAPAHALFLTKILYK
jgi:tRNA pseudouridine38-40 synthase